MAARRRVARQPKLRLPQFFARDELRPGRHTRSRQGHAAIEAPPAPPEPRSRPKPAGQGARAQLATRAGSAPLSPRVHERAEGTGRSAAAVRNYPARKATTRRTESALGVDTREQLAARSSRRAAQGHAPSKPHPASGAGARSTVKARGVAARAPSPLPGDKSGRKTASKRRELTGATFAGQEQYIPRGGKTTEHAGSFGQRFFGSHAVGRPPQ